MLAVIKGPHWDNGFDSVRMTDSELADPNFSPRYVFMSILVNAENSEFLLDSAMFIFDIEQQKITHKFGENPEISTEQIMEMIGEEL